MPRFNALKLMNENKAVMGLQPAPLVGRARLAGGAHASRCSSLIERGVIKPVVAASVPLDRGADAHRFIQERRNIGKVVLTP